MLEGSLELKFQQMDGIIVVDPEGVVIGMTRLKNLMEPLFKEVLNDPNKTGMVIDMSAINFIDTRALGYLCAQNIAFKSHHKGLVLSALPFEIEKMFKRSNLFDIFNVVPDVEAAIWKVKAMQRKAS